MIPSFLKGPIIEAGRSQSLDQLWHEAEQLGRIEVEQPVFGEGAYRVRIRFTRKSGTVIWAEGRDQMIAFAMSKAINEAREMGAGE